MKRRRAWLAAPRMAIPQTNAKADEAGATPRQATRAFFNYDAAAMYRAIGSIVVLVALLGVTACGTTTVVRREVVTVTASTAGSTPAPLGERVYKVPSGSMEPTLPPGSRVIVTPTAALQVGQIVVFYPPEEAEHEICGPTPHHVTVGQQACDLPIPRRGIVKYIKRVVAGPGDEIYVEAGHVYRKAADQASFVREPDSYIRPCETRAECSFPTPIKIPPGDWFLLGDNRGESDDSRFWGPVPTSWIIGVARHCQVTGIICTATE